MKIMAYYVLVTCCLFCSFFKHQLVLGTVLPLTRVTEETLSVASDALTDLLGLSTKIWCSIFLITDGKASPFSTHKVIGTLKPQHGIRIFEMTISKVNITNERNHLSRVIQEFTGLRESHECLTVLAASDDELFLDTFATAYEFDLLFIWKQRPIFITNVSFNKIADLLTKHWTLFANSGMVLQVPASSGSRFLNVMSHLPYSPKDGGQVIRVATWSPYQGLVSSPPEQLFPTKYRSFSNGGSVSPKEALKDPLTLGKLIQNSRSFRFKVPVEATIATEHWLTHVVFDDSEDDYKFYGSMADVLENLAKSINFTYKLHRPVDREWGSRNPDGSWTGLIGLVHKQEADFALGPHDVTLLRSTAIDSTIPLAFGTNGLLVAQTRPKVNPWGFLYPLSPLVWLGTILTFGIVAGMTIFVSVNYRDDPPPVFAFSVIFHTYRLLCQQGIKMKLKNTSERIVVVTWIIGAMIIFWSYSMNLMSLLAIRYAPKPIQTIRDFLDEDDMVVILAYRVAMTDYVNSVESGQLKEMADLVKVNRYMEMDYRNFPQALETLIKDGTHIIATDTLDSRRMIANYFSKTGECQFYLSQEAFFPYMMGMVVQKGSPLVAALSDRILEMMEGGLYDYWLTRYLPNSTSCRHMPTVLTVKESFSLTNIWGVFALLGIGLLLSGVALSLEVFTAKTLDLASTPMNT